MFRLRYLAPVYAIAASLSVFVTSPNVFATFPAPPKRSSFPLPISESRCYLPIPSPVCAIKSNGMA